MAWDSYEFWITNDSGVPITDEADRSIITKVLWFEGVKSANSIGGFQMGLPSSFDTSLLKPDRMIQVWRAPRGGRLGLWQVFLIRSWRFQTMGAKDILVIGGVGPNDLLRRRHAINYAGNAQVNKIDYADDMMREIVNEQFISDVWGPEAGSRDWTDFSVAPELGAGPILTMAFAWRRVIDILKDLNNASREEGTEVFFNVAINTITSSSITFEFRTKTGQPGQDLTNLGVFFDQQRGNMVEPTLSYDYTDEINYVFGLGQGQETDRETDEEYDAARYNISKWGLCEGTADARNQGATNGVRDAARAALELGRPKRKFSARVADTAGTRYGIDWHWGDKVIARYRGEDFDAIIRTVQLSINGKGEETVHARLEWEG